MLNVLHVCLSGIIGCAGGCWVDEVVGELM